MPTFMLSLYNSPFAPYFQLSKIRALLRPFKPELDKVPHSRSLSLRSNALGKYLTKTNQKRRNQVHGLLQEVPDRTVWSPCL